MNNLYKQSLHYYQQNILAKLSYCGKNKHIFENRMQKYFVLYNTICFVRIIKRLHSF